MTTVKAVFQTNHLESILDKSIVAHQLRGDTDCELLALKVKLFIHNGNFLSEKQVRDSLPTLPSRANGMFIFFPHFNLEVNICQKHSFLHQLIKVMQE